LEPPEGIIGRREEGETEDKEGTKNDVLFKLKLNFHNLIFVTSSKSMQRVKYSAVPLDDVELNTVNAPFPGAPPVSPVTPIGDPSDPTSSEDVHEARRRRRQQMETITAYVHSLIWCVLAVVVFYYSKFWLVITTSENINRIFFNIGAFELFIFSFVILYLVLYIPFIDGELVHDYNLYCPRVMYLSVFLLFTSWICFNIALWPVWRLMTPVILTIFYVASILFPSFLPRRCC